MTYQNIFGQPFDFFLGKYSFKVNDTQIWFVAIALSLSAHFAFFLNNEKLNAAPSNVDQETVTHVRFATFTPPPPQVLEPVVEPPKPQPVVPPEPEIVPKQAPKPEPVKKMKKKAPKPKPKVQKKEFKPKPKPKKPVVVQQPNAQLKKQDTKPVKASPVVAKPDHRLIEQTRMTYQALLMRHIEVHKHYPRVARKRKIQGDIIVSFTLFADGSIKNLQAIGKKSILKKATVQAIKNALPMPKPPGEISLPMDVKFTMNYFLK